ncbi:MULTISPECIES: hypothetical protein [unclassified Nocardia]|uniref:hypothetical protein n=1 Tax=unclassified Nocardia TaxID=2637762 RepID=UPI0033BC139F
MTIDSKPADRLEYWRGATLATAGAMVIGVTLFGALAALSDRRHPDLDPGAPGLVSIVVLTLCVLAAAIIAVRRSPRLLGVATGVFAAAMVIGLAGLVLR